MQLKTIRTLPPFSLLDIDSEYSRINHLFTEENADLISEYFKRRSMVESQEQVILDLGVLPKEYDKAFFKQGEALLQEALSTLQFYDQIGEDLILLNKKITEFINSYDNAERFDEAHLLPIALEIFGNDVFPVKTEYISVMKTKSSKNAVTARRLYFNSYYSFIVTDFFEGLHYGHYVRICPICERYFLMQSARRQKYCSEMAPEQLKGKPITCRKLAARQNRKELASADPVKDIYTKRLSVLRSEKQRGTVSEEFVKVAKALAKEYMQRAMQDNQYAKRQYIIDMKRNNLYSAVDRAMSNH